MFETCQRHTEALTHAWTCTNIVQTDAYSSWLSNLCKYLLIPTPRHGRTHAQRMNLHAHETQQRTHHVPSQGSRCESRARVLVYMHANPHRMFFSRYAAWHVVPRHHELTLNSAKHITMHGATGSRHCAHKTLSDSAILKPETNARPLHLQMGKLLFAYLLLFPSAWQRFACIYIYMYMHMHICICICICICTYRYVHTKV